MAADAAELMVYFTLIHTEDARLNYFRSLLAAALRVMAMNTQLMEQR
jgi:hypothetical protein